MRLSTLFIPALVSGWMPGDHWLTMSIEQRKATVPKKEPRYSAQELIKQRFPDGIPEYTGTMPEDECIACNQDGLNTVDPNCFLSDDGIDDGIEDWIAFVKTLADSD